MRYLVEKNQLKYWRGFSYSTTATTKLYATVILQCYYGESSALHHIQFFETLQNI